MRLSFIEMNSKALDAYVMHNGFTGTKYYF